MRRSANTVAIRHGGDDRGVIRTDNLDLERLQVGDPVQTISDGHLHDLHHTLPGKQPLNVFMALIYDKPPCPVTAHIKGALC